jgi:hypothetical protein
MSTTVITITKTMSTMAIVTTSRLETNPNSLVEYVTTLTIETKEDGTESKSESTKEYILEEINKHGEHRWYNRAGQLHRDGDLPAFISADGAQHWYKEGKWHRDGDLPAIICADGRQDWYKEGKWHRDGDLPAIICANGDQQWYKEGTRHRDGDLPAVIYAGGKKIWYKNDIQYTPSIPIINRDKLLASLESLQLGLAELTKELTSH